MASRYYLLAAVLALAFTFVAAGDNDDKQKEVKLMLPLFDAKDKDLKPAEVLDLLHKLEEFYVSRDGNIDEAEKNRREVIFTLAARAEIKDTNCRDKDYFVEFKELIKTVGVPNIERYLEHFMKEQVKVCKSKDPNFQA